MGRICNKIIAVILALFMIPIPTNVYGSPDDLYYFPQLSVVYTDECPETCEVRVENGTDGVKYKLRFEKGDELTYHDLSSNGDHLTVPFVYGNGTYVLSLYEHLEGTKYQKIDSEQVIVDLEDENDIWLASNYMVDYEHSEKIESELRKAISGMERYGEYLHWLMITNYVHNTFGYDYVRKFTDGSNFVWKALDETINTRLGLCGELSAVAVGMLREDGIHSKMVIGTVDDMPHAWVSAKINGRTYEFDPTSGNYLDSALRKHYTAERYF